MNTAKKFTFDTEFKTDGDVVSTAARARQKRTLTNEEIEQLAAGARHEGLTDGQVAAAELLAANVAALKDSIVVALDASHDQIEAVRAEATQFALAAARKIAPAALAALPAGDVEAALRQAMHQAIGEPRLTLRANPIVTEALAAHVESIAYQEGYDGRVMLAPDPTIGGADCRIEWRGGGAERSEQVIEEALAALIEGRFSNMSNNRVKG